ncbi:4-alpha-glucanotransferase [Inmirania thermothiophila]|uniref:4-alpha-glucanotransferase n=1 Tax=Inmirania thermothiophila TaxID=1750597 RepID=A0A3N1Y1V2_9GAMM|nr:4-alpha-glucanotransferase [Inmirania thermothiophila]ROR32813.1 4-alpha-glucanotransferase [Inmirania thermothiophila]
MSPIPGGRAAGVLCHVTSLPGPDPDGGTLGAEAHRFARWLGEAGLRWWQVLPLGPTHEDRSPYQPLSAFAGDARLIDLEALAAEGWLDDPHRPRAEALAAARQRLEAGADEAARADYARFCAEAAAWLEDYALFAALRAAHGGAPWWRWPAPLRDRDAAALAEAARGLADAVAQVRFEQFVFWRQWRRLREAAAGAGVRLMGDLPIFVALDSAEVWAARGLFDLDAEGRPRTVAGVPPDYFSADGQRWGNPLYRWEVHAADGYRWWVRRVGWLLRHFDLVRIDHFRGFAACWAIPAGEPTARNGRWVPGPGRALFDALRKALGPLPLVAEDLGYITDDVVALREGLGLPGMRVLQFAFDGGADNPHLPHNHARDLVVYTGTHDNDTTLGWFEGLDGAVRGRVLDYLGRPGEPMPWPLVRAALASVAVLAMVPMQDLLGLGAGHRMNRPGTTEGNWRWRFGWAQVPPDLAAQVAALAALYGR